VGRLQRLVGRLQRLVGRLQRLAAGWLSVGRWRLDWLRLDWLNGR
jgi:hypothetical protein